MPHWLTTMIVTFTVVLIDRNRRALLWWARRPWHSVFDLLRTIRHINR